MERVLLVGQGPLPAPSTPRVSFPQLRVDGIRRLLLEAGHEVHTVLLGKESTERPREGVSTLDPQSPSLALRVGEILAGFKATRVISAGPFMPARIAALAASERLPLLVDVPGDPFAEAQAKDAQDPESRATLETVALWRPVLARADAFLAISSAQAMALRGQLGLMGRLASAPLTHTWVRVVPVSYDFGALPGAVPQGKEPGTPLRVLLAGGFNTWLDDQTLLEGLHQAMGKLPDMEVRVTGGGIPGHHGATFERFKAGAMGGPFPERFLFHGWVPHAALPSLTQECHVGLWVDRPGLEATLGSRTRALFYTHQGLTVACTPRCEMSRELATMGLVTPLKQGRPDEIARVLVKMGQQGVGAERVEKTQAFLHRRYRSERALAPVLNWVSTAVRLPAHPDVQAQLAEELHRTRGQLDAVHQSPTWRVAGKARRVMGKLGRKKR